MELQVMVPSVLRDQTVWTFVRSRSGRCTCSSPRSRLSFRIKIWRFISCLLGLLKSLGAPTCDSWGGWGQFLVLLGQMRLPYSLGWFRFRTEHVRIRSLLVRPFFFFFLNKPYNCWRTLLPDAITFETLFIIWSCSQSLEQKELHLAVNVLL